MFALLAEEEPIDSSENGLPLLNEDIILRKDEVEEKNVQHETTQIEKVNLLNGFSSKKNNLYCIFRVAC